MPENNAYIIAAYAVTWIAIVAYAFRLHGKRAEAERRLEHARHSVGGTT